MYPLANTNNASLLIEFHEYLKSERTSERYQNDVLKVLIKFSEFAECDLDRIQKREEILAFLNTKRKRKEDDQDEKWITTWNDYLWRIKYFYRWLHNCKKNEKN